MSITSITSNAKCAKRLLTSLAAAALFIAAPAFAQSKDAHSEPAKNEHKHDHDHAPAKKDEAMKTPAVAAVGSAAPTFTLKDTEGKEVSLANLLAEGKPVVLVWFNPDCPFIVKQFEATKTLPNLAEQYKDKATFVAINSGAAGNQGAGVERNKKAKADWKIGYSVLIDDTGATGHAYGAKTTPHCFVIAKDGTLAYAGAIDDDSSQKTAGKTNYVAKALDEVLAGKEVTTKTTAPYGCSVKYGK